MTGFTSEYGQRLNAARTAAGLSQTDFGNKIGLTRSSIANVEAGRQACTAEQVVEHAEVLGIDPHWLLTGGGPDQPARLAAGPGIARRLPDFTTELRRLADRLDALAEGVSQ